MSGGLRVRAWMIGRSLRLHLLSTVVTVLSCALASALAMATFDLSRQSRDAFLGGDLGFDAVLGARGSALQLVLNAVFHLDTSPGNISWTRYEEVARDPRVSLAVPLVVGDNYQGFRVVGTAADALASFELDAGDAVKLAPGGRWFDETRREAVIGSTVSLRTGLDVGRSFHAYHGAAHHDDARHDEEYVVVGVLAPTRTPVDRVLWIPIEGAYRFEGHLLRGAGETYHPRPDEPIPDEHKEVSAALLRLVNHAAGFQLSQEINREGHDATLAWPIGRSIGEVFDKLGFVNRILEGVAWLVMAVAAAGILAAIYNTMNERRREFAVLRALGARRRAVFGLIVTEATAIAAAGALLGVGLAKALSMVASWWVARQTGVVLDPWSFQPAHALVPAAMIALGAVAGLIPAASAYRTDVAENL